MKKVLFIDEKKLYLNSPDGYRYFKKYVFVKEEHWRKNYGIECNFSNWDNKFSSYDLLIQCKSVH